MTSIINMKLKPNAPIKIIMETLAIPEDNYPEGGIRDQFLAFRQEAHHLVDCLLVMAALRQRTRSATPDRRTHEEALFGFIDTWLNECFELPQDRPGSPDKASESAGAAENTASQPASADTTPDSHIVQ